MRYSKDWEDYELSDLTLRLYGKVKRKINTGFSLMLPTFVQEQVVADGRYILKFLHLGR